MENNRLSELLFSTPLLRALDVLLQDPDTPLSSTEVATHVKGFKKSSVSAALHTLAQLGLTKQERTGQMRLNQLAASPIVRTCKLLSNLLCLHPLVAAIRPFCQKIILFGSRANGTYGGDSDFDLFIVSDRDDAIYQTLSRLRPTQRVQPIIKTSLEMLTFQQDEPVLAAEISKGITLWDQM